MYFYLINLFILIKLINSQELFTSSAELQQLVHVEKEIPKIIENYILLENKRLENLKSILNEYLKEESELFELEPKSVLNPLNAFRVIKKLAKTWEEISKEIQSDLAENYLKNISNQRETRFPNEDDLNGAIQGLLRLQDTYKLKTKDLANGIVEDININKQMDAKVCYEIGLAAYNEEDYYHSILWMEEANERYYLLEKESTEINKSDILNILSISLYKQGNLKRALIINDKLIELDPLYPNATNNSKLYKQELLANGVNEEDFRINIPPLNNYRWGNLTKNTNETDNIQLNNTSIKEEKDDDSVDIDDQLLYESLCRDEVSLNITEISKLYCYYKMDRPFLRLAPIKVEIIRFEPLAVIFRNIIADEEIEILKKLSKPKLRQAKVQDPKTGNPMTASYRISKSAWLRNNENPTTELLDKRIGMMTSLDMGRTEQLQIGNYGIGGHYESHYDFALENEAITETSINSISNGNRIGTVLFYLSTPEKGGYTVFTDLKTVAKPTKNDALFWYNLWRSGKGDMRTRHAACPVLLGDKWVSNSWLHERGQEFVRPCGLDPSIQERYVGDLGGPEPRKYPNISPY
uniref:procollagen-proline 4-dioxygenase n=1 Tax=Meloidogyne incognita TaxID=6306 RepID=A0A914LK54_MELIC